MRRVALLCGLALLLCAVPASAFTNGYGITVVRQSAAGREIDLTVTSTAVQGTHEVIVLLPQGYDQALRYPVLYLLHGALEGPQGWVPPTGAAPQITAPYPLITVIPDGGLKGWYTDWASGSQQRWQDFHLDQLVPWIDANLSTIADRSGRAVAGLSAGGFGAIHYAEARPDLFSYAASFSGALDLTYLPTAATILAEEIGIVPDSGAYAPPGSIFGPLGEIAESDVSPANVARLRNTTVALYTGVGDFAANLGGALIESQVKPQNDVMARRLSQAGVSYWYSQDHVSSPSLGWGCDDNHDHACWNAYLADDLPRMMSVLAHP
jgi:S-formylglutathione hydrolase FrmB